MVGRLTPEDKGKPLVTPSGDVVGVLDRIDEGAAYVRPNPGLFSGYGSWIGEPMQDVSVFRLDEASVAEVDSDRVVIGRNTHTPSHKQGVK